LVSIVGGGFCLTRAQTFGRFLHYVTQSTVNPKNAVLIKRKCQTHTRGRGLNAAHQEQSALCSSGLRSGIRSRSRKESEVFWWSPSRIFCPTPTAEVQLNHFLTSHS